MTREDLINIIFATLENIGIYIDVFHLGGQTSMESILENDIDLREYISDSVSYITFMVELEECLNIEFPSNLLHYDAIASLQGFAKLLMEIIINGKEASYEEKA